MRIFISAKSNEAKRRLRKFIERRILDGKPQAGEKLGTKDKFPGLKGMRGGGFEGEGLFVVELEQGSLASGNGTNPTKCKIYCVLLGSCDK